MRLSLKAGRERKIRGFYPWVQRGELTGTEGELGPDGIGDLHDATGGFLARGTVNLASRFPFRVLSLEKDTIDAAWFARRLREAEAKRAGRLGQTDSWRSLFAEADGVPGLIIDRYRGHLAVQVRTLGMERLRETWLPGLLEALEPESVFERSEMEGRRDEGLGPRAGQLQGSTPDLIEIDEDGLRFLVPLADGLKTGYYLDQRAARRLLAQRVRPGDKVLDCFSYTGAFSMHASRAGARTFAVDLLPEAVDIARENARLNGLEVVVTQANAFEFLTNEAQVLGPWDWILLDPPAIAKTKDKRDSLKWGIWRLVHEALPGLKPGGMLVVSTCSYQLSLADTLDICRLAAGDRGLRLNLEGVTFQDIDHPAPVSFPEALYLKTVWLRRD